MKENSSPVDLSLKPYEYFYRIVNRETVEIDRFSDHIPLASITIPEKVPLCVAWSNKDHGPMTAIGYADGSVFIASDLTRNFDESCFLTSHRASILGVCYHHTEFKLASVSLDGSFAIHERHSIRDWKTTTTDVTKIGLTSVCWKGDDLVIGASDGVIRYFKKETNNIYNCLFQTKMHPGYVRSMTCLVNSDGADVVSYDDDSKVKFLAIKDKISVVSELDAKPLKIDQLIYNYDTQILTITFIDAEPTIWRCETDGIWRQFC